MKLHELLKYVGGPQKISIVDVSPLADGKLAKSIYIGDILDYNYESKNERYSVVQIEVDSRKVLKIIVE